MHVGWRILGFSKTDFYFYLLKNRNVHSCLPGLFFLFLSLSLFLSSFYSCSLLLVFGFWFLFPSSTGVTCLPYTYLTSPILPTLLSSCTLLYSTLPPPTSTERYLDRYQSNPIQFNPIQFNPIQPNSTQPNSIQSSIVNREDWNQNTNQNKSKTKTYGNAFTFILSYFVLLFFTYLILS